jgi:hypothetical protein
MKSYAQRPIPRKAFNTLQVSAARAAYDNGTEKPLRLKDNGTKKK